MTDDTHLADPRTLLGAWRLERRIEDHVLGEDSRLHGTLTLVDAGEGRVRWEERAAWERPDGPVAVRRDLWLVERAGEWEVLFEDERPFHPWVPGERVVHDCAPDVYRGTVSGTAEGWSVVWDVEGPSKDYTMTTWLTRPDPS